MGAARAPSSPDAADKVTGEQRVVADLGESRFVLSYASDACYLYAAIEGGRTIARIPR